MGARPDELALAEDAIAGRLRDVPEWRRVSPTTIERTFVRRGFRDALAFIGAVADLAEARDHHPDIHLERYRRVRLVLTTHACDGLSDADFDLALAIDAAAG